MPGGDVFSRLFVCPLDVAWWEPAVAVGVKTPGGVFLSRQGSRSSMNPHLHFPIGPLQPPTLQHIMFALFPDLSPTGKVFSSFGVTNLVGAPVAPRSC